MCDLGERSLKKSCHLNDRGDRSLWTHTEFLRVNAVNFNWLHLTCYAYLIKTMILILLIRNNSPNNSLDFTRRKGLQGNHISDKFDTSPFLHKINWTSTKLTLKGFDNQPLRKRERWTSLRGRWWVFSLLLFYNFDQITSAKCYVCFQKYTDLQKAAIWKN